MADIKKPEAIGTPSVVKIQLLGLARACNEKRTKAGSLADYDPTFNRLIKDCESMDSGLTKAMLLVYGRPDLSVYDIPNLDPERDAGTVRKIKNYINEEKIKEAISLIEEAMADESKVEFPGVKGVSIQAIKEAEKHVDDFKPVWERYIALQEEGEQDESIERLKDKRARYVRSRKSRMEEVAYFDRKIAEVDADIEEVAGETKSKIAEIAPEVLEPGEELAAKEIEDVTETYQLIQDLLKEKTPEQQKRIIEMLQEDQMGSAQIAV